MKKTIVSIVALALVSVATNVGAQGTVTFANSATSLVTADGAPVPVSNQPNQPYGGLVLGLFWGATGSAEGALVQIGANAAIAPLAGRYSAGTRTTGLATAPGDSAVFQVRAWSAALGATWAEALISTATGYRGSSTLFTSATGGAGTPPSTPVNLNTSVPGFAVVLVPEPSVIALAILGAGALLLRRRKA